jgi:hypothetical protein
MKLTSGLLLRFSVFSFLCCAAPVNAQAFLDPVSVQPTTFLQSGSNGSSGASTQRSNAADGSNKTQTYDAGVPRGRELNLQATGNGLLAPNSLDQTPVPSGSFNLGFPTSESITVNLGNQYNQYGLYNGQALPVVSSSSVDVNDVDCPNLAQNYAPGIYNPWAQNLPTQFILPNGQIHVLHLQETAQGAAEFLSRLNTGN